MRDYYTAFKKCIPQPVRKFLKPLYLSWSLRSFTEPQLITVKEYGFSMWLNPQNGAVDHYLFMHKNWEMDIGSVIVRELKPGDTFVDVGANIGYFSLLSAQRVGQEGRVIAFEPLSRIAKQCGENVAVNNFRNVSVRQVAIGDTQSRQTMSLVPGNIGGSSLVKESGSGMTEAVTVSTLDVELADVEQIAMIKIDVEGYEREVLLGAKTILMTRKPKLVLEFSPNVYQRHGSTIAKSILEFLFSLGYSIHDINNNVGVRDIQDYLDMIGREQTNLFATPKI